MTASVLLPGARFFTRSWQEALRFVPPIIAFIAAVWVSQGVQLHSTRRSVTAPYQAVLLLEAAVLLVLSLLPATTTGSLFTTSIAFAAAVQMQTFREVNGRSYCSTLTTGNLRTFSKASFP